MIKTHKRKILIPKVTETNLDNTFVSASQVDSAMNYMFRPIQTIGHISMAKTNQKLFARLKMPALPAHLQKEERPKQKSRLTKIIDALNWRNW
jgi:hypothetical protein